MIFYALSSLAVLVAYSVTGSTHMEDQLVSQGVSISNLANYKLRGANITSADEALGNIGIASGRRWQDMVIAVSRGYSQSHFFCDRLAMFDFMSSLRSVVSNSSFISEYARYLEVTMDSSCRLWVCKVVIYTIEKNMFL